MQEFKKQFPEILFDEPLNKYSTFAVGGPADFFYKAKKTSDIQAIINFAKTKNIPFFVMGGGSNILFDDKGFRGLIIKIEASNVEFNGEEVTAECGVTIAKFLKESIEHGLSGIEEWTSLPGTIGGAVRGNAGCNGIETKDILVKAEILDPESGKITIVSTKDLKYGYRESILKKSNQIVLKAVFKLKKREISPEEQQKLLDKYRETRLTKQPFNLSGGSFFKNPSKENPAGMLIEKAGLKGKTIGKAQVSEKHANFLINLGGATSEDIKQLANLIKKEVKDKFNIELKEEVQILAIK